MAPLNAYYPDDEEEQRYMRWLEAPGEGLGMVLGDAPSPEDILKSGGTLLISKSKPKKEEPKLVLKSPKKKCNKCGGTNWADMRAGLGDCCLKKALPKKDQSEAAKPAKKAKQSGAAKQVAGKGGKVRSSYPGDKGSEKKPAPDQQSQLKQKKANPAQAQPEPQEGPPVANPADLANMLGMPITSLQRIAHRFRDKKDLGGRAGFVTFMKTRLKKMATKHKLDGDYFGLIYDALCPQKAA